MTLVGEAARRAGHTVQEWDLLHHGEPAKLGRFASTHSPDVIGVSMRNVDNVNSQATRFYLDDYRRTIAALRENSGAPIVLGGAAFSLFPEELLRGARSRLRHRGRGEEQFRLLVEELSGARRPTERIRTGEAREAQDEGAPPGRSPELAKHYLEQGGMLNLQVKRGCPWRCAYCSYPLLGGGQLRFRSPRSVVRDRYKR